MTREEAKQVFLSRGFVEIEGGTIYDANKWREACVIISDWLEQESSRDIEEIEEVINCDVDAETKCKIISNILTAKPHYFEGQEPIVTSTNNSGEMIYPQVEGITPTVVESIPNIDKKVESYKKLLKHPVVKHIMDLDETQEQIDFVQPHKKVPVTLTVESGNYISRQDAINSNCYNCSIKTNGGKCSKCDAVKAIEKLPSFIPQSCEVEEIKLQQAYDKGFEDCRQAMLNTLSELNAISFYEAQEDSKECYYEIRQVVEKLQKVEK